MPVPAQPCSRTRKHRLLVAVLPEPALPPPHTGLDGCAGSVGVLSILEGRPGGADAGQQVEDLVGLARLILALGCSGGPLSLEVMAARFSPELVRIVHAALPAQDGGAGAISSWHQVWPSIGPVAPDSDDYKRSPSWSCMWMTLLPAEFSLQHITDLILPQICVSTCYQPPAHVFGHPAQMLMNK